ncbi:ferredoxin-thioredoxin reductase catalytic domain-containing protein [Spirochaetia bacterium 38H-sp]|uniref:ferredoxin:thioredoxin reductase n=1 Tax=Rarispira pelagica TaxID=3141764 RepID=A0ABU9U8J7_9SPIR
MKPQSVSDVFAYVKKVAEKKGWKLNYDARFLSDLVDGMFSQYQRHGYFLCPCRESWDDIDKDRDVICPCAYAEADIAEYGHCFCGLYLSDTAYKEKKEVSSIPERRPEDKCP